MDALSVKNKVSEWIKIILRNNCEEDIKLKDFLFEGDRAQIRMSTVRSALEIILKEINTGN